MHKTIRNLKDTKDHKNIGSAYISWDGNNINHPVNLCSMKNHEENEVNDPKTEFIYNAMFTISKGLDDETRKLKKYCFHL